MTLTYPAALDFLFPRVTTIKFGLATTRALLASLGNPHKLLPTVHIGGTNGKGSVSTLVAAALGEAGWRVGLYTSPHLISFRERIVVDGSPISEAAVAMWTGRMHPLIVAKDATFFEVTTAIAFADFAARGAEIAVVEVGLGGRLDSTNVVRPLVSAITKIEMDHMKYLGDTLEAIACEKAAIAKPGAPFVIGERRSEVVAVLSREATRFIRRRDRRGVPDIRVVPPEHEWEGPLRLAGRHQRRNAAVADAVLKALPESYRPSRDAVRRGFAGAALAGRLDRRGKWLFDVAHNPDGMRTLMAAIEDIQPPRPLHGLISILGDKEWPEMLVALDAAVDRGVCTIAPTAANRGWNLDWLDAWLKDPNRPPPHASWSLVPDFPEALRVVQHGAETVLVTGSFHTVGDVMAALGMETI